MPNDNRHKNGSDDRPSSPYGPQHGHIDEAAGGADSSPLENIPSGDQAAQSKERPQSTKPKD